MPAWSDRDRGHSAGGEPLAVLATRLVPAGARVLLAGPHHPTFVKRLAYAEVTCLLRALPDADALTGLGVRVVVGGVDGIDTDPGYDVVVAAAGLDPVESVEGTPLGWSAVLDRLVAALRPGGTLLLGVANPFGLSRLVDATPWYAGRDDARWAVAGVLDTDRPANLDQLLARLTAVGLRPQGTLAAYPDPVTPTALLSTGASTTRPTSGLFDAVLHAAYADRAAPPDAPLLQDPARLAVDALHAGLCAALAPGWLVVAHLPTPVDTGPDPAPVGADPDSPGAEAADVGSGRVVLPVALVEEPGPDVGVAEVYEGADGWRWRTAAPLGLSRTPDPTDGERSGVHRDPAALTGPVAEGRLLRTLLLDATVRRDLRGLRRLLTGYADWVAALAVDDLVTGAPAVAGVTNVVVSTDGGYAVLDPSRRSTGPVPTDLVLARTLRGHAADLLTGGYAHPWTSTVDANGLTVVLAGLAGRDLDRSTVADAVEWEATVTAALRGPDPACRVESAAGPTGTPVEPSGAPVPTGERVGPGDFQQLREAWRRQGEELTRLRALVAWTQDLLDHRERALRRAETKLGLLSGSLSYRLGRLAVTPLRLARRGAGAAKRQFRTAVRQHRANRERS
ncbi:class I SAM-dependent methyltransferase [Micromonospora sp. NPDC000207]|uniref:class I SAM-dependent methyltransferase n=1 Tax=Micromonospora sp. NPDC000207 TaxID=3154246 RepID=UPI00332790F2